MAICLSFPRRREPSPNDTGFPPSSRSPVWLLVFLIVIGLAGASLRFSIAISDSLWLDELHSAWATGASLNEVAARADSGNQTPLYFWLVWCFRQLSDWLSVPESNLSLRFVSLLAGCGAIVGGCYLVWNWTRSYLAVLCASLLMAVDTSLVSYSTEARPYALMQLAALIQVGFFWTWLSQFTEKPLGLEGSFKAKSWNWSGTGLAVSTAVLILIHVTSLWLPVSELIFFVGLSCYQIRPWNYGVAFQFRPAWTSAIIIALLTALLMIPSLLEFKQIFNHRENWGLISDREQLLADLDKPLRWGILMPVMGMILFYLSQSNRGSSNRTKSTEQVRDRVWWQLAFVGAWGLVPVVGTWMLDYCNAAPMANARYTQVGAVAIPIFSALAIGWLPKLGQQLTLTVLVLIGSLIVNPWLVPLFSTNTVPQFRTEDWASTIQEINRGNEHQPRPILLFANLLEDSEALSNINAGFQEYLKFPLYGVPQVALEREKVFVYPTLNFQGLVSADLENIPKQGGAWIVVRGRDPLVGEIVAKIFEQVKQSGDQDQEGSPPGWRIEFARFTQTAGSDVKLFMLTPTR